MKDYRRKPDLVKAVKFTGNVRALEMAIGSAFVKQEDDTVSFYDVSIHRWVPILNGDYVVRDESGAYRKEDGHNFESEYEEFSLGFTPRTGGVVGPGVIPTTIYNHGGTQ